MKTPFILQKPVLMTNIVVQSSFIVYCCLLFVVCDYRIVVCLFVCLFVVCGCASPLAVVAYS